MHALSIDVEDWYHDFPVNPRTPRGSQHARCVLDIVEAHGVTPATFFLGEAAERFPAPPRAMTMAATAELAWVVNAPGVDGP